MMQNMIILYEYYPYKPDKKASNQQMIFHARQASRYLWPVSGYFPELMRCLKHWWWSIQATAWKYNYAGLEQYYDSLGTSLLPIIHCFSRNSDRYYDDMFGLPLISVNHINWPANLNIWKVSRTLAVHNQWLGWSAWRGIYWCEQKKQSKNTCSMRLLLFWLSTFESTKDSAYYKWYAYYNWTKTNLQDSTIFLFRQ